MRFGGEGALPLRSRAPSPPKYPASPFLLLAPFCSAPLVPFYSGLDNRQYTDRYQENYNQNESGALGFPGVPYISGNGGLPQLTFSDASTLGSPTYLPAIERQNTYVLGVCRA
jgi:hypothetical protein